MDTTLFLLYFGCFLVFTMAWDNGTVVRFFPARLIVSLAGLILIVQSVVVLVMTRIPKGMVPS